MAKISNLTTKIVNAETGEEIERPMNAEELEQLEAIKAVQAAYEVAKAEQAADKAALLARLGLTEDELKTILG
jgi:regulator of RNase E activity RraB